MRSLQPVCRWMAALSCLVAASMFAAPARAVPFDNQPKILLHLMPVTSKNACTWGSLTDCRSAVTAGGLTAPAVGPYYFVYLLAARGDEPGLAGLQCGLSYDNCNPAGMTDGQGVDIFSWTLCASLQFPTDSPNAWPGPGSGNLITWERNSNCQSGEVAVAGYFYVGAYSEDELRVMPRLVDRAAKVANCGGAEIVLAEADLGSVRFTVDGGIGGCNPCDGPCPAPAGGCIVPPLPPRPDPAILLHVVPSSSGGTCGAGVLADPGLAVTSAELTPAGGGGYFVYLLAARGWVPDVAGLECGITYQNNEPGAKSDHRGIDILSWTLCATLEFKSPSPAWPSPGSGNIITWDTTLKCQTGATAVAGYFYVAAYGTDQLRVIPRPANGLARVADCDAIAYGVPEDELGRASFSPNADVAGCNPVLTPCAPAVPVLPSTWSGIKTLYGR